MKFKKLKKGFTLVELVVVIAVIAILGAASVGAYFGIIGQANKSADEQAIAQMNTILQTNEVNSKNDSILNVFQLFDENGLNAKEYKPLTKDTGFYWCKTENRIFILDEVSKNVIYPSTYENFDYESGSLYSLSGEMMDDTDYETTLNSANKIESVTITNGNELYSLTQDIDEESNKYNDTITIKINNDIDLMGVSGISIENKTKNIVFDGTNSTDINSTIYGLVNYANQFVSKDENGVTWKYSYGLIPTVENQSVVFKNININAAEVIGEDNALGVGILIGQAYDNSNITFDNVNITNSYVHGGQFVGGFVGRILAINKDSINNDSSIEFTNSSISSTTVSTVFGQSAGLVGSIAELCNFTDEQKQNPNLAMGKIKNLIILYNTIVANDVDFPTVVEKISYTMPSETQITHGEDSYKIKDERTISTGIYLYPDDSYGLFSTAKLFNINPTFRHDAKPSLTTLLYNGKTTKFNCALIPINDLTDLDNIEIINIS